MTDTYSQNLEPEPRQSAARIVWVLATDDSLRRSMIALLESSDFDVTAFAGEDEMLALLHGNGALHPNSHPDCIIIDEHSLRDRVRDLMAKVGSSLSDAPVILIGDVEVTGGQASENVVQLVKPYSADELLETIETAITRPPSE